jgi:LemA protein
MTKSVVLAMLIAVWVFWGVGAYNRLVRLRAEVVRAFAAVDEVLSLQQAMILSAVQLHTRPAGGMETPSDELVACPSVRWADLPAAAHQYARALASARAKPLDSQVIAALRDAQNGMADVWRLIAEVADEPWSADLPEGVQIGLERLQAQARLPAAIFDDAVRAYNAAIQQFPALLLARMWGFRAAACLQARGLNDIHNDLRVDN